MPKTTTTVKTTKVSVGDPAQNAPDNDEAKAPRHGSTETKATARVRVPLRVHPDTKERAAYWAQKANLSVNEYMAEAVEAAIRRENLDYDLPTLEIQRLAQLIDEVKSLSSNNQNLEVIIRAGFDSLLGLVRGDNYLLEREDGELTSG